MDQPLARAPTQGVYEVPGGGAAALAWGSAFLPSSAIRLGQRVLGNLCAGTVLRDRVGPATLL